MHRRHPNDPPAIEQFEPHRPLFLFGDAHGCATELVSLLRKAAECIPPGHDEPSTEHVIILASGHRVKLTLPKNVVWLSLGDAFSKGPDPWGIYEIFQSLGVLMVRGNHEHRLLRRQYRTATGVHDGHRRSQQLADTLGANKIQHVVRWIEQSPYIVTGAAMPCMPGKKRWRAVHAGPDMRQGVRADPPRSRRTPGRAAAANPGRSLPEIASPTHRRPKPHKPPVESIPCIHPNGPRPVEQTVEPDWLLFLRFRDYTDGNPSGQQPPAR
jgi:hypothetical protein